MLKKDITFDDLEGNTKTQTHYFHMTKYELTKMYGGEEGKQFLDHLKVLIAKEDPVEMIKSMESMILAAYGKKTSDDIFDKAKGAYADEFRGSMAFDALMMELMTNAEASAQFIRGIMPKNMMNPEVLSKFEAITRDMKSDEFTGENLDKIMKELTEENTDGKNRQETHPVKSYSDYTRDELMNMDKAEFDKIVGTDVNKMTQEQFNLINARRQLSGK